MSDIERGDPHKRDGYGFEYSGSGMRCPECGTVGTYAACFGCGAVIVDE